MNTPRSNKSFGLLSIMAEDWQTNCRDWTQPGFRALTIYRFGVWRMGIRFKPLRLPCSMLYRFLYRWVRNHYGIELYYTTKVGRRFQIAHQSGIVIHPHAEIGDDCIIRQNVTIGAVSHNRLRKAPKLGNDVQVGAGATILGNVTIGDGARIGPNAVIMTNVPAGATAFATPARIMEPPNTTLRRTG